MDNYGYTSVRVTVPGISGKDKTGKTHRFDKPVPVIQNRVNGRERSVTVLDRPNGRAIARLTDFNY